MVYCGGLLHERPFTHEGNYLIFVVGSIGKDVNSSLTSYEFIPLPLCGLICSTKPLVFRHGVGTCLLVVSRFWQILSLHHMLLSACWTLWAWGEPLFCVYWAAHWIWGTGPVWYILMLLRLLPYFWLTVLLKLIYVMKLVQYPFFFPHWPVAYWTGPTKYHITLNIYLPISIWKPITCLGGDWLQIGIFFT